MLAGLDDDEDESPPPSQRRAGPGGHILAGGRGVGGAEGRGGARVFVMQRPQTGSSTSATSARSPSSAGALAPAPVTRLTESRLAAHEARLGKAGGGAPAGDRAGWRGGKEGDDQPLFVRDHDEEVARLRRAAEAALLEAEAEANPGEEGHAEVGPEGGEEEEEEEEALEIGGARDVVTDRLIRDAWRHRERRIRDTLDDLPPAPPPLSGPPPAGTLDWLSSGAAPARRPPSAPSRPLSSRSGASGSPRNAMSRVESAASSYVPASPPPPPTAHRHTARPAGPVPRRRGAGVLDDQDGWGSDESRQAAPPAPLLRRGGERERGGGADEARGVCGGSADENPFVAPTAEDQEAWFRGSPRARAAAPHAASQEEEEVVADSEDVEAAEEARTAAALAEAARLEREAGLLREAGERAERERAEREAAERAAAEARAEVGRLRKLLESMADRDQACFPRAFRARPEPPAASAPGALSTARGGRRGGSWRSGRRRARRLRSSILCSMR